MGASLHLRHHGAQSAATEFSAGLLSSSQKGEVIVSGGFFQVSVSVLVLGLNNNHAGRAFLLNKTY